MKSKTGSYPRIPRESFCSPACPVAAKRHFKAGARFAYLFSSLLVLAVSACSVLPEREVTTQTNIVEMDPIKGSVFIFDDGRVESFLRREGDNLVWATRQGREYIRAANPALPILSWEIGSRSGRRQIFGNHDDLWPPQGGVRARFRVLNDVTDGKQHRHYSQAWSCSIEKERKISVPAGKFPAHKIVCDRFSVNSMRIQERRTWWWSQELGHYVRRRYQNLADGAVRDIKLCAALPEIRANRPRIDAIIGAC